MDCRESEELFVPYVLGALDSEETEKMAIHLEACAGCRARMRQENEIVEKLTYAVPQLPVPPSVKQRLISRIEAEGAPDRPAGILSNRLSFLTALGRGLAVHSGLAVASMLIVAVVLGGVWYNGHLNRIALEKQGGAGRLASVLDTAVEQNFEMTQLVKEQRHLRNMSIEPAVSVSMLSGRGMSPNARGMIVVPPTGEAALLAVLHLPPLPVDKIYQVWLIKSGGMYSVGMFTVDSSGFGQTKIELIAPLRDLEAIVITVERAGGSPGPTGESVLMGEL